MGGSGTGHFLLPQYLETNFSAYYETVFLGISLNGLSASKRVSLGIFNTRSDIIFFCISSVPPAIEDAGNETRISAIVPSLSLIHI